MSPSDGTASAAAPDDQRFVIIRALSVDAVMVVENFFEELKAKVGN